MNMRKLAHAIKGSEQSKAINDNACERYGEREDTEKRSVQISHTLSTQKSKFSQTS
jgi:hypothetical protein